MVDLLKKRSWRTKRLLRNADKRLIRCQKCCVDPPPPTGFIANCNLSIEPYHGQFWIVPNSLEVDLPIGGWAGHAVGDCPACEYVSLNRWKLDRTSIAVKYVEWEYGTITTATYGFVATYELGGPFGSHQFACPNYPPPCGFCEPNKGSLSIKLRVAFCMYTGYFPSGGAFNNVPYDRVSGTLEMFLGLYNAPITIRQRNFFERIVRPHPTVPGTYPLINYIEGQWPLRFVIGGQEEHLCGPVEAARVYR